MRGGNVKCGEVVFHDSAHWPRKVSASPGVQNFDIGVVQDDPFYWSGTPVMMEPVAV